MSIFLDTSAALDSNLNDMPGKPDVAWENFPFEPAVGTLWIRPTILPGDTVQASLGTTGQDMSQGIYQVDVFAEAGAGKNEAVAMADKIADQFKRGTILTYNDLKVRISAVSRQASVNNSDGWFQIPINVVWISYTEART